jgi:hypothetical protein
MSSLTRRIERHNRDMREAMMTAEEALAWAEDWYRSRRRWPVRRYRIVAHGLCSRLLTEESARKALYGTGGRIVELIPPRKRYVEQRKAAEAAQEP